jgi:tellurite methyltransferase
MMQNDWETYWGNENNLEWWTRPRPEVLEFITSQNPQQRPDVLDLGCGLGRHAVAFAEAGFNITAVDSSETAIAYLRKWAERLSLSMRTKIGDVFKQTLQNDMYDIVLSYNVLHHGYREQFAQAIGYIRTLLRPEGLF